MANLHQIAALSILIQQRNIHIDQYFRWRRRRLRRKPRSVWVRPWIQRRNEYGMYDKLMGELRSEDPKAFQNFMRMSPNMFNELLGRLRVRLTKTKINFRENLEPGLKLAINPATLGLWKQLC